MPRKSVAAPQTKVKLRKNSPKDEGEAETLARSDAFELRLLNEKLLAKRDPAEGMTIPSAKATARGSQALI